MALPTAESVSAMLSRAAALPDATLAASTDGRRCDAERTGSLGGGANAVSAETAERTAQACTDMTLTTWEPPDRVWWTRRCMPSQNIRSSDARCCAILANVMYRS